MDNRAKSEIYTNLLNSLGKNGELMEDIDMSTYQDQLKLIKTDLISKISSDQEAAIQILKILIENNVQSIQKDVITLLNNDGVDQRIKISIFDSVRSYLKDLLVSNNVTDLALLFAYWKDFDLQKFTTVLKQVCYQNESIKLCKGFLFHNLIPVIMSTKDMNNPQKVNAIDLALEFALVLQVAKLSTEEYTQFLGKVNDYIKNISELRDNHFDHWHKLWIFLVRLFGTKLHHSMSLINKLLRVVEHAFRNSSYEQRLRGYDCWKELIDNVSLDSGHISSDKQIRLLLTPLRAKFSKQEIVIAKRFEVFVYLIQKLQDKAVLVLKEFLEFCFGEVGEDTDPSKAGQGKSLPELWNRSTKVLLAMLGHSHGDNEHCLDTNTEIIFKVPVLNSENISNHHCYIVNSVVEACIMLKEVELDQHRNTVLKCFWSSLLGIILDDSSENKQCLGSIGRALDKLLKENDPYCHSIAAIILKCITHFDWSKSSNLVSDNLKHFIHIIFSVPLNMESCLEIEKFQTVVCTLESAEARKKTVNTLFDCFINYKTVESNANFVAQFWIFLANELEDYAKNQCLNYLVWPALYMHHVTDVAKENLIFYHYKQMLCKFVEKSEELQLALFKNFEKLFKANPLLLKNILTLVTMFSPKMDNKELINTTLDLLDFMMVAPLIDDSTNQRNNIELYFKKFYEFNVANISDNETIKKICSCLQHILKLKHYDIIHNVENILKPLPDHIKWIHGKYLSLDFLMNLFEKETDLHGTEKIHKLIELFRNIKNPEVKKERNSFMPLGGRSAKIAKLVKQIPPSPVKRSNSPSTLRLFGKDIDTLSPLRVKGSQLKDIKGTPTKSNSPSSTPKSKTVFIDDESNSKFVLINSEVKLDKQKLTEHQKETLRKRREDIPALYQDLSQSMTQSLDSNSTSDKMKEKLIESKQTEEVKQINQNEEELPAKVEQLKSEKSSDAKVQQRDNLTEKRIEDTTENLKAYSLNIRDELKETNQCSKDSAENKRPSKEELKKAAVEAELKKLSMNIVGAEEFLAAGSKRKRRETSLASDKIKKKNGKEKINNVSALEPNAKEKKEISAELVKTEKTEETVEINKKQTSKRKSLSSKTGKDSNLMDPESTLNKSADANIKGTKKDEVVKKKPQAVKRRSIAAKKESLETPLKEEDDNAQFPDKIEETVQDCSEVKHTAETLNCTLDIESNAHSTIENPITAQKTLKDLRVELAKNISLNKKTKPVPEDDAPPLIKPEETNNTDTSEKIIEKRGRRSLLKSKNMTAGRDGAESGKDVETPKVKKGRQSTMKTMKENSACKQDPFQNFFSAQNQEINSGATDNIESSTENSKQGENVVAKTKLFEEKDQSSSGSDKLHVANETERLQAEHINTKESEDVKSTEIAEKVNAANSDVYEFDTKEKHVIDIKLSPSKDRVSTLKQNIEDTLETFSEQKDKTKDIEKQLISEASKVERTPLSARKSKRRSMPTEKLTQSELFKLSETESSVFSESNKIIASSIKTSPGNSEVLEQNDSDKRSSRLELPSKPEEAPKLDPLKPSEKPSDCESITLPQRLLETTNCIKDVKTDLLENTPSLELYKQEEVDFKSFPLSHRLIEKAPVIEGQNLLKKALNFELLRDKDNEMSDDSMQLSQRVRKTTPQNKGRKLHLIEKHSNLESDEDSVEETHNDSHDMPETNSKTGLKVSKSLSRKSCENVSKKVLKRKRHSSEDEDDVIESSQDSTASNVSAAILRRSLSKRSSIDRPPIGEIKHNNEEIVATIDKNQVVKKEVTPEAKNTKRGRTPKSPAIDTPRTRARRGRLSKNAHIEICQTELSSDDQKCNKSVSQNGSDTTRKDLTEHDESSSKLGESDPDITKIETTPENIQKKRGSMKKLSGEKLKNGSLKGHKMVKDQEVESRKNRNDDKMTLEVIPFSLDVNKDKKLEQQKDNEENYDSDSSKDSAIFVLESKDTVQGVTKLEEKCKRIMRLLPGTIKKGYTDDLIPDKSPNSRMQSFVSQNKEPVDSNTLTQDPKQRIQSQDTQTQETEASDFSDDEIQLQLDLPQKPILDETDKEIARMDTASIPLVDTEELNGFDISDNDKTSIEKNKTLTERSADSENFFDSSEAIKPKNIAEIKSDKTDNIEISQESENLNVEKNPPYVVEEVPETEEIETEILVSTATCYLANMDTEITVDSMDTEITVDVVESSPIKEQTNGNSIGTPGPLESDLPSSPVTGDTPNRTSELLNCTSDISPIAAKTSSSDEFIEQRKLVPVALKFDAEDIDLDGSKEKSPEKADDAPTKIDEMSPEKAEKEVNKATSNSPPKDEAKTSRDIRSIADRSSRLFDIVKSGSPAAAHRLFGKRKSGHHMSPSASRIKKLMSNVKVSSQSEFADSVSQEDILTFTREVPSPLAVPRSSILKRKHSDTTEDGFSPCPKRKRVNFSDPCTTSKKVFIKDDNTTSQNLFGATTDEELDKQFLEVLAANDIIETPQTESENIQTEQSLEINNPQLLRDDVPIYPDLVDCEDNVSVISRKLTSPMFVNALLSKLNGRNIHTIGDLARQSEVDIARLPFKNPMVANVYKALDNYYHKNFRVKFNKEKHESQLNGMEPEVSADEAGPLAQMEVALAKMDVQDELLKALERARAENLSTETLCSLVFSKADHKEILRHIKTQFKLEAKDLVYTADFPEVVKYIVDTLALPKVFELLTESLESTEEESVYFDCMISHSIDKKPLSNLIQKRSLQELRAALWKNVENGVYTKADLLNTCFLPFVNSIDLSTVFNKMTVVELEDIVISRLKTEEYPVFTKRILEKCSDNSEVKEVIINQCEINELTDAIIKKGSPKDIILSFTSMYEAAPKDNDDLVRIFRLVSDSLVSILPPTKLMELSIEFQKKIPIKD